MATQRQGDATRMQQGIAVQRGQRDDRQGSLSRRSAAMGRSRRGATQANPIATMRRMFDDLDVNTMSSPFAMVRRMFNNMERMLETVDLTSDDMDINMVGLDWVPRVDIRRRDRELIVRADLPGIRPDQIRVSAQDDALVIEGERNETREDQDDDVWQAERVYGYFRRVIPLPEGVKTDNIDARFDEGVLEISLPISQTEARGRRIEVHGTGQGRTGNEGYRSDAASSQSSQQSRSERH